MRWRNPGGDPTTRTFELWLLLHFEPLSPLPQSGRNQQIMRKLQRAHPAFADYGNVDKRIWLTPEASATVMTEPEAGGRVRAEIGDVFLYLTRLADVLGIDLLEAARLKLDESERRYDAETYRGANRKAPPLNP